MIETLSLSTGHETAQGAILETFNAAATAGLAAKAPSKAAKALFHRALQALPPTRLTEKDLNTGFPDESWLRADATPLAERTKSLAEGLLVGYDLHWIILGRRHRAPTEQPS
jgi:hypothetical protein